MAFILDLLQLREWSECLCRLPATEPLKVVLVLKVTPFKVAEP